MATPLREILQIIPSTGWMARQTTGATTTEKEVICWALVSYSDDVKKIWRVIGMVLGAAGELQFTDTLPNFSGYRKAPPAVGGVL